MPLKMARSFDEPWPMMHTPRTPKQRRTAVFAVIEAAAEIVECPPREQRTHLRRHGARERLAQHIAHKTTHAFACLQRHVAHKAVAHNHVCQAGEDVAALNVANELDRQIL